MLWAFLAILAVIFWAWATIFDKIIFEKYYQQVSIRMIFYGLMGLAAALFVFPVIKDTILFTNLSLLCLAIGTIYVLVAMFYFKSILIEEASRVALLFHLSPLFVLVLATIFLGEIFTSGKYVGVFLVIIGVVLISFRKIGKEKFKVSKAMWFMLFDGFLFAVIAILVKYVLNSLNYLNAFFWINIGAFIGTIPLLFLYHKPFAEFLKSATKAGIATVFSEAIHIMGFAIFLIAVSLGPISLISALGETMAAFTFGFVILLSAFRPQILKEDLKKSTMLLKVLAVIIMFIGSVIIIW